MKTTTTTKKKKMVHQITSTIRRRSRRERWWYLKNTEYSLLCSMLCSILFCSILLCYFALDWLWLYWWVVFLMVMATIMVIAMALMALKIKIAWSRFSALFVSHTFSLSLQERRKCMSLLDSSSLHLRVYPNGWFRHPRTLCWFVWNSKYSSWQTVACVWMGHGHGHEHKCGCRMALFCMTVVVKMAINRDSLCRTIWY